MALSPPETTTAKLSTAKAAASEPPAAESACAQASPAAKALRSMLPAAETTEAISA
jgi:hypothetical protein